MTPESLGCIGVHNHGLKLGDAIVAVGRYGDNKGDKALYKYITPDYDTSILELNCSYSGLKISSLIDFKNKNISIKVNSETYAMKYIKYIGHIVVLDGNSKKLKFYQTQGYTARGEAINDLLMGRDLWLKEKTLNIWM